MTELVQYTSGEMELRLIPSIHRATHQIGLYLQRVRPPLGLSQGEAHLLSHLHEVKACSVAQLHHAFAHRRSSLTSYLDRLAEKRLIHRAVHPDDRRSFLVSLTSSGRTAAARVHRALLALERRALRGSPASLLEPVLDLLERVQNGGASKQPPTTPRRAKR